MRYATDLGFASIHRDKPISKGISQLVKTAYARNKRLFGRNPSKFDLVICDSDSDFKRHARYYYQKWATATVLRDCTLVIRGPKEIDRLGKWSSKDLPNLLTHEVNHVFWQDTYHLTKPVWLSEGLACCIGETIPWSKKDLQKMVGKYNVDYSFLDYRYLDRKFKHGHVPRYPLWAHFTGFLIASYSERELIKFMDLYSREPNKDNYHKAFQSVFGASDKQLFNEFISQFKK